jgi:hypothetical protein
MARKEREREEEMRDADFTPTPASPNDEGFDSLILTDPEAQKNLKDAIPDAK